MKKALLITGGTVAGVAAVLSYTPAQLSSASGNLAPSAGGATINSGAPATSATQTPTESTAPTAPATSAPTDAAAPTPTSTPKSSATKKPKSSATSSTSGSTATTAPATAPTQTPTQTPTPTSTPTPTKAAPSNVTVTGRGYNAGGFGTVSVQITVTNGVVTAAKAVSYPNRDNRSAWISQQAIPWLVEQTLAAKNSANIAGVGGATYTTNAWINSLQSALTAAGL